MPQKTSLKFSIQTIVLLSFILAFSCLLFFSYYTYRNLQRNRKISTENKITLEVLNSTAYLFEDMQNLETGYRGYLLTGKESYLQPYFEGMRVYRNHLGVLQHAGIKDTAELDNIRQLALMVERKAELAKSVAAIKDEPRRSLVGSGIIDEGKKIMDAIRFRCNLIENKERTRLRLWNESSEETTLQMFRFAFAASVVMGIFLLVFYIIIYNSLSKRKKMEEVNRYHASLLKNISDAVVATDAELKITNWTDVAEEMYGWTAAEAIGKKVNELLKVDYIAETREDVLKKYYKQKSWKGEVLHHKKNGEQLTILTSATLIRNDAGDVEGSVAVMHDITQQKKLQEQLLRSEEEYRKMVDEVEDYAILLMDTSGNIRNWNKGAEKIKGYSTAEIIGKNFRQFYTCSDQELKLPEHLIEQVIAYGRAADEGWRIRKDGSLFWASVVINALHDARGGINGFVKLTRDLTDRKRSEEKLQRFNESLAKEVDEKTSEIKSVFERVSDAFIALDDDWTYTYVNRKAGQLFNRDPQYLTGKHIWAEFPESMGSSYREAYERAMRIQEYQYLETYFEPQGLYFEHHIYPSPNGLSVYLRDITERKKAEQEILTEKLFSDAIVNSLPGVFYLYDDTFRFLRWNTLFEKTSGYTPEEISGMSPLDFFAGEQKETLKQRIGEVFAEGTSEVEADFITKEGKAIPFYFTGVRVNFRERSCLLGIGTDISKLKAAEQLLIQSEEKYRKLFESNPLPMMIIERQSLRFLDVNDAAIKQYGYSYEEFLQLTVIDLQPEAIRESFLRQYQSAMTPVRNILLLKHQRKDNSQLDVQITYHNIIFNHLDARLVLADDITAMLKTQAENKRLATVLENTSDFVGLSDMQQKMIFVNKAARKVLQFGETEDVSQRGFLDDTPPGAKAYFLENILPVAIEQGVWRGEGVWTDKTGKETPVSQVILVQQEKEGQEGFIASIARDISEAKRRELEVQQVNEELRALAASLQNIREEERTSMAREIHDDLGQQLTAIKIDVSWVARKMQDTAEVKEKVNTIIQMLSDGVKSIRRISTQLRPSILDDLGLIEALRWQKEEFEKRYAIPVHFEAPETTPVLEPSTATGLFRIFQETLTNIVRHADATAITAALRVAGDQLILQIADNGKGFNIDHVKVKKTLGLLGMKERTIMMGGHFEMTSQPGAGTTVSVFVPLMPEAGAMRVDS